MKRNKIITAIAVIAVAAGSLGITACAGNSCDSKRIAYSEVSAPAKQVLGHYFAGQKIQYVKVDKDHGKTEYDLKFVNGTEVEIDAQGVWSEISVQGAAFPMSILPESISTYLKTNYPRATVVKAERDSKGYEVKCADGMELKFSASGEFIKTDR